MSEPGDILGNRLKRAGITPEEYAGAIHPKPQPASDKMLELLNKHVAMKPGPERDALWEEIHDLFGPVADELHEIAKQRPSAYILAEELRINSNLPSYPDFKKKKSIWTRLFGRKK